MSPTIYATNKKIPTNKKLFDKMIFIMNALENGWKVKKIKSKENKYVFYKKCDDNNEDITNDSFLESFVKDGSSLNFVSNSRL